jgi:repressor LexA
MKKLTARQREILDLIKDHLSREGCPPTRAEIVAAMGFRSPTAAEDHLQALARKGVIELIPGLARNIRLLESPGAANNELPLVGRVAAGAPVLAQEHIEAGFRFDPALFQPRADYLLRVRGMSMRDAGIFDGDLLAVHRTAEAISGQVVVARLDEEVTVKRLESRAGRVRLLPENPDFAAIEIDGNRHRLQIEGIVVGVIRTGRL